jgi:hypothetical protein
MSFCTMGKACLLVGLLILAVCGSGAAEGFRNIASVTAETYFNGDWRIETTDVFLARIVPALTAVTRLTRVDSEGWNQHLFYLGPVVSFTDTLYLEAVYGLGIDSDDSDGRFSHELDVNFNYETDTTATSLGLKANWFPGSGYSYYIPSISGKFHPLPALGLFGKFFLSIDSDAVLTESFWGQADYRFSPLFGARAGFTVSRADAFGYSLLAGLDFFFRSGLSLKYSFQYLSDSIEPLSSLQPRSGISNALILDARF